mmetsp:Transcript_37399/g.94524  ORF Transcript_37399/g.94524 Transcript_37399/m.94524 type:complete len:175 (+) Transcript_37399:325-849(+)
MPGHGSVVLSMSARGRLVQGGSWRVGRACRRAAGGAPLHGSSASPRTLGYRSQAAAAWHGRVVAGMGDTPTPGYDGLDELITAERLVELTAAATECAWHEHDAPYEVIDLASVPMGTAEAETVLQERDGYDLRTRHQLVANALDVVLGSGGELGTRSACAVWEPERRSACLHPS